MHDVGGRWLISTLHRSLAPARWLSPRPWSFSNASRTLTRIRTAFEPEGKAVLGRGKVSPEAVPTNRRRGVPIGRPPALKRTAYTVELRLRYASAPNRTAGTMMLAYTIHSAPVGCETYTVLSWASSRTESMDMWACGWARIGGVIKGLRQRASRVRHIASHLHQWPVILLVGRFSDKPLGL